MWPCISSIRITTIKCISKPGEPLFGFIPVKPFLILCLSNRVAIAVVVRRSYKRQRLSFSQLCSENNLDVFVSSSPSHSVSSWWAAQWQKNATAGNIIVRRCETTRQTHGQPFMVTIAQNCQSRAMINRTSLWEEKILLLSSQKYIYCFSGQNHLNFLTAIMSVSLPASSQMRLFSFCPR